MRALASLAAVIVLAAASACSPPVDLSKALEVSNVVTGWVDAGIVNGQNKLVPAISFTLKNNSNQTLAMLQVNAIFRRVNETEEWGSAFLTAAGSTGVPPGATTGRLTMKSQQGYTGTEPRQQMLQNTHFVDAKVELSAKYGRMQWTRIGNYPIERKLITP